MRTVPVVRATGRLACMTRRSKSTGNGVCGVSGALPRGSIRFAAYSCGAAALMFHMFAPLSMGRRGEYYSNYTTKR